MSCNDGRLSDVYDRMVLVFYRQVQINARSAEHVRLDPFHPVHEDYELHHIFFLKKKNFCFQRFQPYFRTVMLPWR